MRTPTRHILAVALMLLALPVGGVCLALNDPGGEDAEKLGEATAPMFPDGVEHDFGKVQRGKVVTHAFRIVNTSRVPLQIVALRYG